LHIIIITSKILLQLYTISTRKSTPAWLVIPVDIQYSLLPNRVNFCYTCMSIRIRVITHCIYIPENVADTMVKGSLAIHNHPECMKYTSNHSDMHWSEECFADKQFICFASHRIVCWHRETETERALHCSAFLDCCDASQTEFQTKTKEKRRRVDILRN
jgi:hypothetical protein